MTSVKKYSLVVFSLQFLFSGYSQSIAVEQFDSPPVTLHDFSGSSAGWFSNWMNQNDYTGAGGYSIVDAQPMTHPNVSGIGNYCVGGGDFTSTGRYFDVGGSFGDFEDANGRIGVGTIYFTFLIRKEEDNDTPIEIIFADDPVTAWAINEELIKIGYFGLPSNFGGDRYWSVAAFNESVIDLSGTTITIGQTYYVVVEINFDVTTTINMWVDPINGEPDLLSPDASVSSTEDLGFWNIVLFFEAAGTGHGSFDEFFFSDELEAVLPVELVSFEAFSIEKGIKLIWTTATEISNERFIIERSNDGLQWHQIGEVAGNGNSSELIDYSFEDFHPFQGINYYRLVQVDYDGQQSISEIVKAINEPSISSIQIYQNGNVLKVNAASTISEITFIDLSGRRLSKYNTRDNKVEIPIVFKKDMMYIVHVKTDQTILRERLFIR